MPEPDWSLWRSFGAVVEHGSLSAAARALGLSQPTLGRHVEALEQALGVGLFERTLAGLRPTDTALKLYEPVQSAQAALAEANLMAEGASAALTGSVRITSSTVMCHYVLPPLLYELRQEFPQVALELVPSDAVENLLLREADIAVRMFRPTQLELIAKRLGQIPIVACAHERYVAARGAPAGPADLAGHDLVGFDRSDLLIDGARQMGFTLGRNDFVVRTDSQTNAWELIKAGLGIGFAQSTLVAATPGMVRLLPGLDPPPLEVWLTTHRELFTSRRIRAIYDRLSEGLVRLLAKVPK
ncbi:MAG: LysR family transcriptional regulator [Devosia sp.]|uniref:LysR family transcriptional regulator n=1 Tax=Devosia sp. TaxID=1871048 RepID=UPI001AC942CF|nr:LysR family transcriptional regulator [Devosia sp.]MBN9310426.1 LysR family transcriptional regulator [Devosia sp.]MBN9315136.1 LysR family transcriptional regulator [Devosia sp.]